MNYPAYCKTCDAITGHETYGRTTKCIKCHTEQKTPLVRWFAGIALIVLMALFLLWIILTAALVIIG